MDRFAFNGLNSVPNVIREKLLQFFTGKRPLLASDFKLVFNIHSDEYSLNNSLEFETLGVIPQEFSIPELGLNFAPDDNMIGHNIPSLAFGSSSINFVCRRADKLSNILGLYYEAYNNQYTSYGMLKIQSKILRPSVILFLRSNDNNDSCSIRFITFLYCRLSLPTPKINYTTNEFMGWSFNLTYDSYFIGDDDGSVSTLSVGQNLGLATNGFSPTPEYTGGFATKKVEPFKPFSAKDIWNDLMGNNADSTNANAGEVRDSKQQAVNAQMQQQQPLKLPSPETGR